MKISSCHKTEAFNGIRAKPQVRAEIAGFASETLASRAGNGGSVILFARRLRYSMSATSRRNTEICKAAALPARM
jgi:hypothetical protein